MSPNVHPAAMTRAALAVALVLAAALLARSPPARADRVSVAVATNFAEPMSALAEVFRQRTGHDAVASAGASGALYAQIKAGAPFDILLSADAIRPADLEREGLGVPGTRFTFSIGRLALWSSDAARIASGDGRRALAESGYRALAIADPALAPYGKAAKQALMQLGLWEALQDRIVIGKNIGQTHALVATGNAELGFVALSSLTSRRGAATEGSLWIVPADLHEPIRQDAILLASAASKPAARAFIGFLRSTEARRIVEQFGYGLAP